MCQLVEVTVMETGVIQRQITEEHILRNWNGEYKNKFLMSNLFSWHFYMSNGQFHVEFKKASFWFISTCIADGTFMSGNPFWDRVKLPSSLSKLQQNEHLQQWTVSMKAECFLLASCFDWENLSNETKPGDGGVWSRFKRWTVLQSVLLTPFKVFFKH